MSEGVSPHRTAAYLSARDDVLDAVVLMHAGELEADVVVAAWAAPSERELKRACLESLGLHQTPRRIRLRAALRPVA